jgi:hypothetical protein
MFISAMNTPTTFVEETLPPPLNIPYTMPISDDTLASSPHVTPTTSSAIINVPPEILTAALSYLEENKKDVEAARLVCRGFNNCAWPAFGAVIANVVVDMRGQRSWDRLIAISAKKELTPYVKELEFGCGYVPKWFPGPMVRYDDDEDYDEDDEDTWDREPPWIGPEEYLGPNSLDELRRAQSAAQIAHAPVWSPREGGSTDGVLETKVLVENLTSMLTCFPSLHSVGFCAYFLPPIYNDIYEYLHETDVFDLAYNGNVDLEDWYGEQRRLDSVGLNILLQALASDQVPVRHLEIPVKDLWHTSFCSPTSFEAMRRVLSKLTSLDIERLNLDGSRSRHAIATRTMYLEDEETPILECLRLCMWRRDDSGLEAYSRPTRALPQFPQLKRLAIYWLEIPHHGLEDLIRNIRGSLRILELVYEPYFSNPWAEGWLCYFINFLHKEAIHLQKLQLWCALDEIGAVDSEDVDYIAPKDGYIAQQALDAVACEVVLHPLHWKMLQKCWAQDGDCEVGESGVSVER